MERIYRQSLILCTMKSATTSVSALHLRTMILFLQRRSNHEPNKIGYNWSATTIFSFVLGLTAFVFAAPANVLFWSAFRFDQFAVRSRQN